MLGCECPRVGCGQLCIRGTRGTFPNTEPFFPAPSSTPLPPPSAPILGRGLNEPAQVECFPSAGAQATSTRGVDIISGGGGRGQRVGRTGSPEDIGMGGTCGIWEPKEAVNGQDAHC